MISSPEIDYAMPASPQESQDSSSSSEAEVDVEVKAETKEPVNLLKEAITKLQAKLALVDSEEIVEAIEIDLEQEITALTKICQENHDNGDFDAWYNLGMFFYNFRTHDLSELAFDAFSKVPTKSQYYGNAKQILASNAFGAATVNPNADSYGEALQQTIKVPTIDADQLQRIAQHILPFHDDNKDANRKTVLLKDPVFVPPEFIACISAEAKNADLIKSFKFFKEMNDFQPNTSLSLNPVPPAAIAPVIFSKLSPSTPEAERVEEPAKKKIRLTSSDEDA